MSPSDMLDILEMTYEDLPDLIDLWAQTDGVGLNESDTPTALAAFLLRNPSLSRVVHDGDRIVGGVLCGHDGRRGFLYHLAVRAEYRRHGLGRALVNQCLAALGDLGIQKCNALVYTHNNAAQRFWSGIGFGPRDDLSFWQRAIEVKSKFA